MMKWASKIIFYFVAACLVAWTASLTFAFVSQALPGQPFTRWFALIVFDLGMVSWLLIFMYGAAGIAQRGIAFLLSVFDLIGVGLMCYAEIFLGGQTFATIPVSIGTVALYAVVIWTVVNLAGVWGYHYAEPENLKRMKIQSAQDKLTSKALDLFEEKIDKLAPKVADEVATRMTDNAVLEFDYRGPAGNGKKKTTTKRTPAKK